MTLKQIALVLVGLSTLLPFSPARAGEKPTPDPAELSLPGLVLDCAGLDKADASQGVPDCIVEAVTRRLQRNIERDAKTFLQATMQDQHRRLLSGLPAGHGVELTQAGPDRAEPAS